MDTEITMERALTRGRAPGRTRGRRWRGPLVGVLLTASFVAGACAPQSPPAGPGGIGGTFGPLTIPLPPIELRPPATNIPVLFCNIGYQPPGVRIVGATVTIPGIRIDPNQPIVSVPNVLVTFPQLRVPLSTITVSCGPLSLPVQVDLILPSQVMFKNVTLNLTARTITLQDPSFTVNGAGLGLLGLDLIVPLPPIVTLPLPGGAIAF